MDHVTTAPITTADYAERIAAVLRRRHGDSRSAAKRIVAKVGAGIGTVRKWLRGDNGPHGVHLIKLMADDDEVLRAVLEMAGRGDLADFADVRAKLVEMKRALEGVEL